jgi:hypothetical protein
MQPCKNIFHIQVLVIYFFCNPTHLTETGTANRWGTTNSKPPGLIIMIRHSETPRSRSVGSYLYYSFVQVHSIAMPRTSHLKLCNHAEPKWFPWAKPPWFDSSSSNFTVQDHILSTAGDALTSYTQYTIIFAILNNIIFHNKSQVFFFLYIVVISDLPSMII